MAGNGVLAVGDSIINGQTYRQFVTPQSWAQWLAESADMPFTKYAKGGANAQQVLEDQLPRVTRHGYDVAAVTVAANDLLYGWDAERYAANLDAILSRLSDVTEQTVVSNVPTVFRRLVGARPSINRSVGEANEIIGGTAAKRGALVLDVRDFDGPLWLHPDRVHATALGLQEMGQRAAELLGYERAPVARYRAGVGFRVRRSGGSAREVARVSVKRLVGRV